MSGERLAAFPGSVLLPRRRSGPFMVIRSKSSCSSWFDGVLEQRFAPTMLVSNPAVITGRATLLHLVLQTRLSLHRSSASRRALVRASGVYRTRSRPGALRLVRRECGDGVGPDAPVPLDPVTHNGKHFSFEGGAAAEGLVKRTSLRTLIEREPQAQKPETLIAKTAPECEFPDVRS